MSSKDNDTWSAVSRGSSSTGLPSFEYGTESLSETETVTDGLPQDIRELEEVFVRQSLLISQLSQNTLSWDVNLAIGLPVMVTPTYVASTKEMFVHTLGMFGTTKKMITDINSMIDFGEPQKIDTFENGTLCAAVFGQSYYRAEVINTFSGVDEVDVFYSDFGNTGRSEKCDIYQLPDEIAKIPRQLIHCQWDLGLTSELSTDHKRTLMDPNEIRKTIVPRVEIATGQYVISLGNYRPRSKIFVKKSDGTVESY